LGVALFETVPTTFLSWVRSAFFSLRLGVLDQVLLMKPGSLTLLFLQALYDRLFAVALQRAPSHEVALLGIFFSLD
jgi:hypothetical protein